jgi:predicted nucleotidyltransferase
MPTALELEPEKWKAYGPPDARRRTGVGETKLTAAERERVLRRVRKIAALFKERFGAKKVILFGSMAHEAWFVSDSDVDIAVEGLGAGDYWRAWEAAEEMIPDIPVDLIDLGSATESLKRAINRYGVEL